MATNLIGQTQIERPVAFQSRFQKHMMTSENFSLGLRKASGAGASDPTCVSPTHTTYKKHAHTTIVVVVTHIVRYSTIHNPKNCNERKPRQRSADAARWRSQTPNAHSHRENIFEAWKKIYDQSRMSSQRAKKEGVITECLQRRCWQPLRVPD